MALLVAQISNDPYSRDERRSIRHMVILDTPAASQRDTTRVLILDLSETGLRIETSADLAVGEIFQVDLPEAGPTEARVVWRNATSFGCEFPSPVSRAVISAALLQTPYEKPELPLAETASTADYAADSYAAEDFLPETAPSTSRVATMAYLTLLALAVIPFIVALLIAPFSAEQFP